MESSSLLGSSKRAKAPANTGQVAHCLVDGCDADLSQCRDYHRRHKVCEAHSKTPKVTIGGREQRFCQQCSRFHSLVEFDEGKRSCRKRLDGHNRRRRKPQATECMPSRNTGLVFSSQHQLHGGRLVSFSSSPQIVPTAVLSSSWGGDEIMQLHNPHPHHHQQQLNYINRQNSQFPDHCPAPQSYKLVNQLHLLQATTATATAMQDEANHKMFSIADDESSNHRALSLLSPPPPATHDPLHYSHYPPFGAYKTKPPPPATDSSALHIFEEGSSSHHQTLTFTWE